MSSCPKTDSRQCASAERLALVLVAEAHRAAEERRHRPANVVHRIEEQKSVLHFADLLLRAVDLHRMREASQQPHQPRALTREVVGAVHDEVQAPGAAREQEALEPLDARRVVQPQRCAVGLEHAQLAALR